MSMAKGILVDNGPMSALSCRSDIMEKSDVVLIIGARLNWMLSFGRGKWNPEMKFIQMDVEPTEIDVNVPIAAPVVGDLSESLDALLTEMEGKQPEADGSGSHPCKPRPGRRMLNSRHACRNPPPKSP